MDEIKALVKVDGGLIISESFSVRLFCALQQYEDIKKKRDEMIEQLRSEMEKAGVVKIETDNMLINYIPEGTRETFDSKALREVSPDLYDQFVKLSTVKPSVRVKIK